MEVNVKVTHEMGDAAKKFLTDLIAAANGVAPAEAKAKPAEAPKEEEAKPATRRRAAEVEVPKEEEAKPVTRRRRTAAAPKEDEAPAFEDMSTDDQLADIQKRITKHTKKGKTADIKELLGIFDAGRASELSAKDYADFSDALNRYDAGETIDEIFPQMD